jgi:hypothetical protein
MVSFLMIINDFGSFDGGGIDSKNMDKMWISQIICQESQFWEIKKAIQLEWLLNEKICLKIRFFLN